MDYKAAVLVECPTCGGDGKETCNNPDHNFIDGIGGEIGRLGCPCCGHDPKHKVIKGGGCETCGGSGEVTPQKAVLEVYPKAEAITLGNKPDPQYGIANLTPTVREHDLSNTVWLGFGATEPLAWESAYQRISKDKNGTNRK